jgi:hypothetical protein
MDAPTRRPVELRYAGKTIVARYRPNDITIRDYDGADVDPLGTARRLILSCLASWTLKDLGRNPYPITARSIAVLPDRLVLDLAAAIAQDMQAHLAATMKGTA